MGLRDRAKKVEAAINRDRLVSNGELLALQERVEKLEREVAELRKMVRP